MESKSTTELESAAQAFGQLSAQHGDAARRRLSILASIGIVVLAILLTVVVDYARTASSGRYARAIRGEHASAALCDSALARKRLWFGPFVRGVDYCVDHANIVTKKTQELEKDPAFSFMVVGDWGRDGMCCQLDVAVEMSLLAQVTKPQFIVAAGDNFYEAGIETVHDSQVERSWKSVFLSDRDDHAKALHIPWYVIVGNHDHEGSVKAQVDLSEVEPFWNMPSYYYFKSFFDDSVFVAFLDTSCMYYTSEQKRYFRQSEAISDAFRDKQLSDVEAALEKSTAKWKIVIGHHPFYSGSDDGRIEVENQKMMRTLLAPVFNRTGVATYISGHEHLMEHYDADGLQTFVSGAGSKIRHTSMRYPNSIFSLGRQGFLQVALHAKDSPSLRMRFIDYTGAVVHAVDVKHPIQS